VIVSGILKFSIGSFLAAIVSFFTTPVITFFILPEQFGIATLFSSISIVLYPLISLCADRSLMRFFYEVEADKRSSLLWDSLLPPIIIFFIMAFVLYVYRSKIVVLFFEINNDKLIYLLICDIFVKIINGFAILIVRMQKKGLSFSVLTFLNSVINTICIIIYCVNIEKSFFAIIIGSIISYLLTTILAIVMERKIWFNSHIVVSLPGIRKSCLYSVQFVSFALLSLLFQTMDKYFIRYLSGFQQLGLYSVSFKIISVLNIIRTGFSTYFGPVAFENYEKNPDDTKLYEITYNAMMPLLILCGLAIILFKDIISLILNKTYSESASVMPFLIFLPILSMLTDITSLGVYFLKKVYYETFIFIILICCSIGFNFLFVRWLGAKGAALVLSLNYILYFFLRTMVSKKLYPMKLNIKKTILYIVLLWLVALINTFIDIALIEYSSGIIVFFTIFYIERKIIFEICKSMISEIRIFK
jgi:O-antigen/teichoic acid export membrane protein